MNDSEHSNHLSVYEPNLPTCPIQRDHQKRYNARVNQKRENVICAMMACCLGGLDFGQHERGKTVSRSLVLQLL